MKPLHELPVAVIGAGPVGLSAAVQLLDRDIDVVVLEAATQVAASLRDWGHVRLFSPWRYNVDKTAVRMLEAAGWASPPPDDLPTGAELYGNYLRPLSNVPALRDRIRLDRRVHSISRLHIDKTRTAGRGEVPFVVRMSGAAGLREEILARAVIDASGTWWHPNPLGAAGVPAIGEESLSVAALSHYGIPDVLGAHRARYAGKTTLVVGAGHSAANTILALVELARSSPGTAIRWATRSADLTRVFGGGDADGLPARGKLGSEPAWADRDRRAHDDSAFPIDSVRERDGTLEVSGLRAGERFTQGAIDTIVARPGSVPT